MELSHPAKKNRDDKEMFADIVQAILSVMGDDVTEIILYGSVARGDNTWESDVDIAVLTTKHYNWREKKEFYDSLWEYDWKYNTIFSIVPIFLDEFNALKNERLFYRNIVKDGIILWTKQAA